MDDARLAVRPSIPMGEMRIHCDGASLHTLLGSCVGIALYDRRHCVGGLAHVVLPDSRGDSRRPGKFIDTAVPALIEQMEAAAGRRLRPLAKIAGGASMFGASSKASIGDQNVDACQRLLKQLSIPILASHCGGNQGRRMTFDSGNGNVLIEIVGQPPFRLG